MKMIPAFVKISALSFLAILFSYGQDNNDRNATIETVKRVTYVKNPKQGLWDSAGKSKIRLVQEIQIGKLDGQEEYLFVYISDVAVNGKGDIYVADRQLNEVREYDREGRYLLTIGRKGQGPGEFQSIRTLSVNKQNDLFVYDNGLGRISIYIFARKPQAFKPGDEWHPERSGGQSSLWPKAPAFRPGIGLL